MMGGHRRVADVRRRGRCRPMMMRGDPFKINVKRVVRAASYVNPYRHNCARYCVGYYGFLLDLWLPLFREKRVGGCDLRWCASRVMGLPLCCSVELFKTPPGAAIKCECPCECGMAGLGRPGGLAELSG